MSQSKLFNAVLAVLYFALLAYCYDAYIGKMYGYLQFQSNFDAFKLGLSVIVIAIFYLLLPKREMLLAYNQLIYSLILIPSLVIFCCGNGSYEFFIITIFACFCVLAFSVVYKPKVIITSQLNTLVMMRALSVLASLYLLGIIAQGGLAYLNFNLSKVYEIRDLASDNLHPAFAYISPIVGKVAVPLLIVIAAIRKNYLYLFFGVACSVLIFGFTSHKAPLVYPFLILIIYYLPWKRLPPLISVGCIAIVLISILDFYLKEKTGNVFFGWFGSLFTRRALLLPSNLNAIYIEFFSYNPIYYWADSKFSFGLVDSPYILSAPPLIGQEFFGGSDTSANTGWIGSGYANWRVFGVGLYSVLLGALLAYFSAIGYRIGERFTFSASFVVVVTMILSSDLTTAILTHGLVALILITLFFRRGAFK